MAGGKKYHINPETGRPNQCTATVRGCKYAVDGEIPEHYSSKEEARTAYEKQMEKQIVQSLKKQNNNIQIENNEPKSKPSVQEIIDSPETQKHYRMASLIQVKAMENAEELKKDIQYRDTLMDNSQKIDQWGVSFVLEKVNTNNKNYGFSKRFNLEDYSIKTPIEGSSGGYSVTYDKEKFENDLNDYIDADVFRKVSESSQKAHRSEKDSKRVRKNLQERLGYAENPRFGVPTGEKVIDKWKAENKQARNYSSAPTKNVPILKDAQKYCTNCNETLVKDESSNLGIRYQHESGDSKCANGGFKRESITCKYCGTNDSKMVSFSQQAWSDETSCKRCGGVDGYAIGD